MKFSFASLFTKLTLATSVAGALAGCNDPEYPTPTAVSNASVAQARVLVVNAAPGTQGVTATLENLPFGTATPYLSPFVPAYTSIQSGLRLLVFNDPTNIPATPTVTPTPTPPPPVVTSPRALLSRATYAVGNNYTVFLTDPPTRAYVFPVTGTSDQGGIRTVTLIDNLMAPAVATNAKIRFVNLAPTATGGNTNYGIFNSLTATSLFSAVPTRAYRATSNTSTATPPVITNFADFTEVAAGSYTLDVRSAVATPITGTQQVVTLAAGKIYTLYVRGIANSTATPLGISVLTHN